MNITVFRPVNHTTSLPKSHTPGQLNLLSSIMSSAAAGESCSTPSSSTNPTADDKSTNTNSKSSMAAMEDLLQQYQARIQELEEENAELRRKQVEIKKAKELYLKIFEDFPALIWRSRLDKLCDYFNRTWLEWTGKTLDQEFGNGWTQGVHPSDFDQCVQTYVAAFDKREAFYMEYRLLDKHNEYRWIADHGRPFYDLDGTTFLGYIGSCYDITENKVNEQKLVQLNATKDKFFSIVAHDLRNPISTFVSVSEMLMEGCDDFEPGELTEIATQMHKDSKNTLLLLENLLDWSKSQADEIKYHPTSIQMQDLCHQVVSQVELCAKAKNITIQHSSTVAPLTVSADKNMLKTVLRNLLFNAVKYTNNGGQIQIQASEQDILVMDDDSHRIEERANDNNGTHRSGLLVVVSDNGVGMTESQLSQLFQLPGETGRHATSTRGTDNERGSGLGLVICRDFIQKHGGNIWAESIQGKGTDFKFTIPYPSSLSSASSSSSYSSSSLCSPS